MPFEVRCDVLTLLPSKVWVLFFSAHWTIIWLRSMRWMLSLLHAMQSVLCLLFGARPWKIYQRILVFARVITCKFELHCFYLAFVNLFIMFFWVSKSVFVDHAAGSINISNILTGKCLAKIRASSSLPIDKCCCSGCFSGRSCSSKKRIRASRLRSTVAEALEDITALFYDEERNEIYTGNRHGLVHVWSN